MLLTDKKDIWRDIYFSEYDTFLLFDKNDNFKVIPKAKEEYLKSKNYNNFDFKNKYFEVKKFY